MLRIQWILNPYLFEFKQVQILVNVCTRFCGTLVVYLRTWNHKVAHKACAQSGSGLGLRLWY
jgi:hypothetical protein